MPDTTSTPPKLGTWDPSPTITGDYRYNSMQTNINKVPATLWGTQGGQYVYTSAAGLHPNSQDAQVYFMVDPNTGAVTKSGNFSAGGRGINDVFGNDPGSAGYYFAGQPSYGAQQYSTGQVAGNAQDQSNATGGPVVYPPAPVATQPTNMAYTPEQEAAARALLAKGDALGQAASQQTGVAYAPAYTSAPYTTPSGQPTYNNPANPVTYTPSTSSAPTAPGVTTGPSTVTRTDPTTGAPTTPIEALPTQGAPQTGQQAAAMANSGQLAMPANGSVVDMLNMAGQDSSFAARKVLAQQYGIQGYTGTAAQNTQLGNQYVAAFNAAKGTTAPDSSAAARAATTAAIDSGITAPGAGDPLGAFYSAYGDMDPISASLVKMIADADSAVAERQSYVNLAAEEMAKYGDTTLLKEDYAETIADYRMTDENVANELSGGGGLVLGSQVRAIAAIRSKALLVKAEMLSNIINAREEAVDRIVQLTQMDRQESDAQLDRKIGLTQMLAQHQMQMEDRARENMVNLKEDIGYDGLAAMVGNNPQERARVEKLLGLKSGALLDQKFLDLAADQKEWGTPYMLGGDYVQENLNTGEIRTAVNVAAGAGGGGGGGYGNGMSPTGQDYSALIDLVGNSGSSVYQQKAMKEGMAAAIANGDWETAYQYVVQGTANNLTGENQTRFENAVKEQFALADMQNALQAYSDAGGDMNLLKGTADNVAKNIGIAINDPRYTEVATQLDRAFQNYRQSMTGAAFGAAESRQYASVIPGKSRSLDLNLSIINGALNYLNTQVDGSISTYFGPSGVSLKNQATGGGGGMSNDDAYEAYLRATGQPTSSSSSGGSSGGSTSYTSAPSYTASKTTLSGPSLLGNSLLNR